MIYFTPTAYEKIKCFTIKAKGEISGLGESRFLNKKDILITDIKILKQTYSYTSTDLDEEAMAKFLNQMMKDKKEIENWNVWWHTHSDFDVFWSPTDDDTIENATGGPLLISIVANKKMEMLGRLDIFNPLRFTFDLQILRPKGRTKDDKSYIKKICDEQVDKYVNEEIGMSMMRTKKQPALLDNVICLTPKIIKRPLL